MKHSKILILSLLAMLSFSACSDEDSYLPGYGKGDNNKDKTGIDFFCNLPDDIEKQVQSASVASIKTYWGFK